MVPHDTIVHHLKVNVDYKLNGVLNNTLPITGEKEQLIYLKTLNDDFQMIPTGPKDVRPYLRPMSSMIKEERMEYNKFNDFGSANLRRYEYEDFILYIPAFERIDWLNAHHFDYRGLIEKGLALEAPEGMYKTE